MSKPYVKNLKNLEMGDIELVGGKNASLGEMIGNLSKLNIKVPGGFATTSYAFQDFLTQNSLGERIDDSLKNLDVESIENLSNTGNQIREWILETEISNKLRREIENEWSEITDGKEIAFAVRSSATAEDLPDASFAGQQETYLNIVGLGNLIDALHHVYASLYTDRAISYRIHHGFKHSDVSLSVGFQQMVKSDVGDFPPWEVDELVAAIDLDSDGNINLPELDIALAKIAAAYSSPDAEVLESEESDEMSKSDLNKLKKAELVSIAKEKGVAETGTKADLIAAILGE